MAVATELQAPSTRPAENIKENPQSQPEPQTRAASVSPTSSGKGDPTRRRRHKQFYMPEGNIVIQVWRLMTQNYSSSFP